MDIAHILGVAAAFGLGGVLAELNNRRVGRRGRRDWR